MLRRKFRKTECEEIEKFIKMFLVKDGIRFHYPAVNKLLTMLYNGRQERLNLIMTIEEDPCTTKHS